MATLIIIAVCCVILATILQIGWGSDKHMPYNTGCLAILLGMRFSKKWLSVLYRVVILAASVLTMILVANWFAGMDLTVIGYIFAVIATALSVLLPIVAIALLNLLMLILIGIICWIKLYC